MYREFEGQCTVIGWIAKDEISHWEEVCDLDKPRSLFDDFINEESKAQACTSQRACRARGGDYCISYNVHFYTGTTESTLTGNITKWP